MSPAPKLAMLDTNIIVHLARGKETGCRIDRAHGFSNMRYAILLSTVVAAEIRALATYKLQWGASRMANLGQMLDAYILFGLDAPEVSVAYVDLYGCARKCGRYNQFRQNDLWIAASAHAAGAVLYTANAKDFDWIAPDFLEVISVDCSP